MPILHPQFPRTSMSIKSSSSFIPTTANHGCKTRLQNEYPNNCVVTNLFMDCFDFFKPLLFLQITISQSNIPRNGDVIRTEGGALHDVKVVSQVLPCFLKI